MASILDLPNELIDPILALCSRSTISRLSLTSKSLHAFLSPRVCKTIDWYWKDHAEPPPIHLLLRTLLRNPTRGRHIESLSLRGGGLVPMESWGRHIMWPYEPSEDSYGCYSGNSPWQPIERARSIPLGSTFSASDMQVVKWLVRDIHRPSSSTWIHEFERGNVDLLVALLLSRLSSLASLDLGFYHLHHSQFVPAILRHLAINSSEPCPFPLLQSVKLALDKPKMYFVPWFSIDLLRAFFFLPKIQSYRATFPEPVLFARPGRRPHPTLLTTLILCDSGVLENTLGLILSSTPALQHLTYEQLQLAYNAHGCGSDWRQPGIDEYVNNHTLKERCQSLNSALSQVRHTLKSLILRHYTCYTEADIRYERRIPYGVGNRLTILKHMHRLTHLEVPWTHLFRFRGYIWPNILGRSLRGLCLRGLLDRNRNTWGRDTNMSIQIFTQLLKSHTLPELEILAFINTDRDYWGDLRALCASLNVDCDLFEEGELSNGCEPLAAWAGEDKWNCHGRAMGEI